MSCNPIIYTADGRRGIGVNQPQSGLDYPLVAPSLDIQYLLADFHLAYEDTAQQFKHPLRIKWLYGVGCEPNSAPAGAPTPTHAADILIVDADDNVVFNSTVNNATTGTVNFSTWCWGLKKNSGNCAATYAYRAYEWFNNKVVCQLIAYQTWPETSLDIDPDADTARDYALHIEPVSAVLDERAVYKVPKRVTSFILPDLNNIKLAKTSVDFAGGFNTQLIAGAEETRNLRKTRPITFNVVPGAGAGKYTDCPDPEFPIYRINGLTGPDVLITAEKCLWMRIPTTFADNNTKLEPVKTADHATQVIGSNCPACCTCDDYVAMANYMNATRDRYKQIGNLAKEVLLAYTDGVERWSAQRDCRVQAPIKACMTAQRCPFMDVIVQYCNLCEDCVKDVIIRMEFTANGNAAIPACGYTTVTTKDVKGGLYQLDGAWPVYTANLGNVDAGNSASVAFRLEFAEAAPTTVRLTATGTTADGNILAGCDPGLDPASAQVTKSLYCNGDGGTVTICG